MKKVILNLAVIGLLCSLIVFNFSSCKKDDGGDNDGGDDIVAKPTLNLSLDPVFHAERCKMFNITPKGKSLDDISFEWKLTSTPKAKELDSTLSKESVLNFITVDAGIYNLELIAKKKDVDSTLKFSIEVPEKKLSYKSNRFIDLKYSTFGNMFYWDYLCQKGAGGDFEIRSYQATLDYLQAQEEHVRDIGGWGGYAVVGFDHTIVNMPDSIDFSIICTSPNPKGAYAVVYVAYDKNQNGKPDDDEWYEIKGEHFGTDREENYEATFDKVNVEIITEGDPGEEYKTYVANSYEYTDSKGRHTVTFPEDEQELFEEGEHPGFLPGHTSLDPAEDKVAEGWDTEYKFKGKRIEFVEEKGKNKNYFPETNFFDIDWAVDSKGNPAKLHGIDFIKIQNASWNEKSYSDFTKHVFISGFIFWDHHVIEDKQ